MIYTFYSYKGGVGRSMALANIAELYYQSGYKVLMVDWDLEAPGLERFFFKKIEDVLKKKGLLDLIDEYKERMSSEMSENGIDLPGISDYLVNIYPDSNTKGSLNLLTAGRRSEEYFSEYADKVLGFDWVDFYENWNGEVYFEWLRQRLNEIADIVFIDSRTGVTEMGGVCTYQLADSILMFCAPNMQNLEGVQRMAKSFSSSEILEMRGNRPLKILIIPARIERAESKLLDTFQGVFNLLLKDEIVGFPELTNEKIWELGVPYIPKYAFTESIAVKEVGRASASDLIDAFTNIKHALEGSYHKIGFSGQEIVSRDSGIPSAARRIRILISTPNDVKEEVEALEALIREELQLSVGNRYNLYLEPVRWEKLITPSMGDIQKSVFANLGEYDIFIGIFWKRFGAPALEHESGSEAEFRYAYRSWKEDNSRPFFIYFCERAVSIDLNTRPDEALEKIQETQKVREFRSELEGKGLYSTYNELEELIDLVRQDLYGVIVKIVGHSDSRKHSIGLETNGAPLNSLDIDSRHNYLKALYRKCLQIPLTVLGEDVSARRAITLDQIFISIDVTQKDLDSLKEADHWTHRGEGKVLSAIDAIQDCDQVVLLGDPGSGKSTFVKHLLANIAISELEDTVPLLSGTHGLLPVLITLQDLAPSLDKAEIPSKSDLRQKALANLILVHAMTSAQELQVPEFATGIQRAFIDEKIFLVLDGMDQVPYKLRALVREAVGATLSQFNLPRILITSRIRSYTGASVFNGVRTYTLANLNEEQIKSFVDNWYQAQTDLERIKESERVTRVEDLKEVATKEPLLGFAQNPMLLTTMAIIHQQETSLPKERVKLYQLVVFLLLRRWELGKTQVAKELAEYFDSRVELMRPMMERLAFEAHRAGVGYEAADLQRMEAIELLSEMPYLGHESLASQFLDYVDHRSGLLVGRGGTPERPRVYSFPHRTIQEYLAGCYLIGAPRALGRLRELSRQGDFWSEAVLLGIEEQVYNSGSYGPYAVLNLASLLSQAVSEPINEADQRLLLWMSKVIVVMGAAEVAGSPGDVEPGKLLLERLKKQLVDLIGGALPVVERVEAGRVLGQIGDPRKELMTLENMAFCHVQAGGFFAESDDLEINIPYSYWIGQYPVTQSQFKYFIDAGGYEDSKWWSDLGWTHIKKKNYNEFPRVHWPFDLPNHPVVGINWFEAHAYTNWLTFFCKDQGWLESDKFITLPNVLEWIKIWRGGVNVPSKSLHASLKELNLEGEVDLVKNNEPFRDYPWEGGMTSDHTKYRDAMINSTSTPGCFPLEVSPYGAYDLCGNILEWSRSPAKKEKYQKNNNVSDKVDVIKDGSPRILHGGSFAQEIEGINSIERIEMKPYQSNRQIGFRLLVSQLKPN